ncbi:hypothetical protein EOD41_05955 [Mucilaginibacter limnophilus]|uniref:HEAT repeat domain-containing protein n=1 Tax=Mucilaginibacter limnophilus TaxID=1932778 RepID=A0A3S3TI03_9SPHI|nr:hypothetical protein [Mucilaginibacter limnophilus]RVU01508.1 hypothetical protein EOD41_05955 [Mucilaginibacter limnophilus]
MGLFSSLFGNVGVAKPNIEKLYSEYQKLGQKSPKLSSLFDRFTHSTKQYKLELHDIINEAINNEDVAKLNFALNIAYRDGIDDSYTKLIVQLLTATWHDEHEDLVAHISLDKLNNDAFTEPIYRIATEPDLYRKYDDEMEPTLRKCIQALKVINSERANIYIKRLKDTGNINVKIMLSMYNE